MTILAFNEKNSSLLESIIDGNKALASCFPFFSTQVKAGSVSWWAWDNSTKRLSRVQTTWLEFCLVTLPSNFNQLLFKKGVVKPETLLPNTNELLSSCDQLDIITQLNLLIEDRISLLN